VTLIDADIDHSVVLQGARIEGIHQRIADSLVGQRACLVGAPRQPKALRLMVGDDSQVELAE
jgi:glucose-1-phosphate thymidylyltransferase